MLKAVDVYSGSADSIITGQKTDAVIVKATQGTDYVNPKCNHQTDLAQSLGKKLGWYHYAGGGNPEAEADYFINNIKNYVKKGILALDWESYQNSAWGDTNWCRRFVNRVHELTGVWCLIYVQQSAIWQVANCTSNCGLWCAWYASMNWNSWDLPSANFSIKPWLAMTGWQFTGGDMDRDIFFLDQKGWDKLSAGDLSVDEENDLPHSQGKGHLDSLKFNKDQFTVSGWFGASNFTDKSYNYVILVNEKGEELARQKVSLTDRPDVHSTYNDLPRKCGFEATFKYTSDMAGRNIRIFFRYTDDKEGNGNALDWYADHNFNRSVANLDDKKSEVFTNKLKISGWYASDYSINLPNRFLILLADGKEIQRLPIASVKREDVANAYPDVYNAGHSGFEGQFNYGKDLVGKKLQVVARYSDDNKGEGKNIDYWFPKFEGPALPTLDGSITNEVIANHISIDSTDNGKIKLNFR